MWGTRTKFFGTLLLFLIALPLHAAATAISARNLPPNGKIRFIVGQEQRDLYSFADNVLDPNPSFPRPGGITRYIGITPNSTCCTVGIVKPQIDRILDRYPSGVSLAIGYAIFDSSCANLPLRAILGRPEVPRGQVHAYRKEVHNLIAYLKSKQVPVFLRIGYEFDGPWHCYNTAFYKEAFKYIKSIIDHKGAHNIATVWQSAAFPIDLSTDRPDFNYVFSDPDHLDKWYPGDEYVDWVGISSFFFQDIGKVWNCSGDVPGDPRLRYDKVLDFARCKQKPVMIAESTPRGFDISAETGSCINFRNDVMYSSKEIWQFWYADFFAYIRDNKDVVRAVAYINSDWENFSEFSCPPGLGTGHPSCISGYWGNSRLEGNSEIRHLFQTQLQSAFSKIGIDAFRIALDRLLFEDLLAPAD